MRICIYGNMRSDRTERDIAHVCTRVSGYAYGNDHSVRETDDWGDG